MKLAKIQTEPCTTCFENAAGKVLETTSSLNAYNLAQAFFLSPFICWRKQNTHILPPCFFTFLRETRCFKKSSIFDTEGGWGRDVLQGLLTVGRFKTQDASLGNTSSFINVMQ